MLVCCLSMFVPKIVINENMKKTFLSRLFYLARDIRSRKMFVALKKYCNGKVLDVGGWDFYLTAKNKKIECSAWVSLEYSSTRISEVNDEKFSVINGDGCRMPLKEGVFDTVLNFQVLEHVFEPIKMVEDIARVLRPGGFAIFLIPQTATLHMAPNHYYNFTRFWIKEVIEKADMDLVELEPLGGFWSSVASRLFHFFFQSVRYPSMSSDECKRNLLFYILYPFMVLFAIVSIPICLILSMGDLTEEPNNHLVVAKKRKEK